MSTVATKSLSNNNHHERHRVFFNFGSGWRFSAALLLSECPPQRCDRQVLFSRNNRTQEEYSLYSSNERRTRPLRHCIGLTGGQEAAADSIMAIFRWRIDIKTKDASNVRNTGQTGDLLTEQGLKNVEEF